jgi:hypothetical protein
MACTCCATSAGNARVSPFGHPLAPCLREAPAVWAELFLRKFTPVVRRRWKSHHRWATFIRNHASDIIACQLLHLWQASRRGFALQSIGETIVHRKLDCGLRFSSQHFAAPRPQKCPAAERHVAGARHVAAAHPHRLLRACKDSAGVVRHGRLRVQRNDPVWSEKANFRLYRPKAGSEHCGSRQGGECNSDIRSQ